METTPAVRASRQGQSHGPTPLGLRACGLRRGPYAAFYICLEVLLDVTWRSLVLWRLAGEEDLRSRRFASFVGRFILHVDEHFLMKGPFTDLRRPSQ